MRRVIPVLHQCYYLHFIWNPKYGPNSETRFLERIFSELFIRLDKWKIFLDGPTFGRPFNTSQPVCWSLSQFRALWLVELVTWYVADDQWEAGKAMPGWHQADVRPFFEKQNEEGTVLRLSLDDGKVINNLINFFVTFQNYLSKSYFMIKISLADFEFIWQQAKVFDSLWKSNCTHKMLIKKKAGPDRVNKQCC